MPGIRAVESLGEMEPLSYDYILETDEEFDVRQRVAESIVAAKLPLLMLTDHGCYARRRIPSGH